MQNTKEKKEWYTKKEILEIYPIGVTTYKKRIKKLDSPNYKEYTRLRNKNLKNSNLKNIQFREIHFSIINELFGDIRVPNLKNKTKVAKWVNNINWDWFGVVTPGVTLASELIDKMNFVFSKLKQISKNGKITLFYSIEKNTEDEYYHSHFLIKDGKSILSKTEIVKILELVAEENTSKETRIFLKPYDYRNYGKDGSNYTLKDLTNGYEILK